MILNKTEFSKLTGKPASQISQWIEEGMPCKTQRKRGVQCRISTPEAIQWICDRQVERRVQMEDRDHHKESLVEHRVALARERERKLRLENDIAEEKVLDADEVEQFYFGTLSLIVRNLEAIPGRCAFADVRTKEAIKSEIKKARHRVVDELNRYYAKVEAIREMSSIVANAANHTHKASNR